VPEFHTDPTWPGTLFEIFLTKRIEYQAKLYEALQSGLVLENVQAFLQATQHPMPDQERIRLRNLLPDSLVSAFTPERVARMEQVCFGFSLTEVDGVFVMDATQPGTQRMQERTQVVQLFFKPDALYRRLQDDPIVTAEEWRAVLDGVSDLWERPWNGSPLPGVRAEFQTTLLEWAIDVRLFVFGFMVGKITEELAMDEQEIWVTSYPRLVNVVRRGNARRTRP